MCPVHPCNPLEHDPPYPTPRALWGCHSSMISGFGPTGTCLYFAERLGILILWPTSAMLGQTPGKAWKKHSHQLFISALSSRQRPKIVETWRPNSDYLCLKGWGFDSRHCKRAWKRCCPRTADRLLLAERPSRLMISLKFEFQSWLLAHWSSVRCSSRGSLGEVRVTHPCPAKSNSALGRPLESPLLKVKSLSIDKTLEA